MNKTQKIQELLTRLNALENLDQGVKELLAEESKLATDSLQERPLNKAIQRIADEVVKVKNDPRLDEVMQKLSTAEEENNSKIETLTGAFTENINSLLEEVKGVEARGMEMTKKEREALLTRLEEYKQLFEEERGNVANKNTLLESEVARVSMTLEGLPTSVVESLQQNFEDQEARIDTVYDMVEGAQKYAEGVNTTIEELRKTIMQRLANIQGHGGGNANRNIAIGGNTSVLSTFTDINLKAGAGTTITYSKNQTTKYTDVTITATGSGSGITRSINSIAVNTAADATASTDFVYICTAALTLTLPTCVGNTNLYTIKNTSNAIITIATTGGNTIDGQTSIQLSTQYTAVDLSSDGVSNWNIT